MDIQAEKESHIQHGKKISLTSDFTIAMPEDIEETPPKFWEKERGTEALLYPDKLYFKWTGRGQTF